MAKTALELTPEELRKYSPQSRQRRYATQQKRLTARAMRQARRAAELLKREFSATRVVMFGSLADEVFFARWSDIDLAAWEITPEKYCLAETALTKLKSGFKLDLVDLRYFRPEYREKILKNAIEL